MIQTAPSLAVVGGRPGIAYCTKGGMGGLDLKYVRADDAAGYVWPATGTVLNINSGMTFVSLVDLGGHPGIAFTDFPGGNPVLRFAYLY